MGMSPQWIMLDKLLVSLERSHYMSSDVVNHKNMLSSDIKYMSKFNLKKILNLNYIKR